MLRITISTAALLFASGAFAQELTAAQRDACTGDDYWGYDPVAAKAQFIKGMQAEGLDPATFTTKLSFRAAIRGYNPDPPTIAQEIATELQTNLGITVTLDLQDSGTFLDQRDAARDL